MAKRDYSAIATRHGIELNAVQPPSFEERITRLEQTLQRTDVPFPIAPEEQQRCLIAARTRLPFRQGNFGNATVELRDFVNEQVYESYDFADHLSWACLIAEQKLTKHRYACQEYLHGEQLFEIDRCVIPDFYRLNARIYQQTQWQLATVNTIIPAELFFTCHSCRYFPVTTFMRPLETDYLQEPDIGHDVAGHVATFTINEVAHVMKHHGQARNLIYAAREQQIHASQGDSVAIALADRRAEQLLMHAGRIYWFTVEFGLVLQNDDIKCFGAGILSSPGETIHSIESDTCNRILIDPSNDDDLLRLASTDYLISEFQKTYFISKGFHLLETLTPERILAAAEAASELPEIGWRDIVPSDKVMHRGSDHLLPNDKYERLVSGQDLDECSRRVALKNLQMVFDGFDETLVSRFKSTLPTIPDQAIQWMRLQGRS